MYANTDTPQFIAVSKVFCPYFPIPDNFVANQIFFAVYSTNPAIQLEMIHYNFYSVCYNETEDPPIDLGPEHDPLNSKGCPQFCPKDTDLSENETLLELYKDTPEVIAFYAKYEGTQVSVRDDHVSYFAGNEDDYRVRMNLEFDENYEIDNIEFHCYVQREHQTEVPQTFILKFLKDWTCNEYGTQRNEN